MDKAQIGAKSAPMTASFFPRALLLLIVGSLIACSTPRKGDIPMADKVPPLPTGMVPDTAPLPPPIARPGSRWVPVRWAELPGLAEDDVHQALQAWQHSCTAPPAALARLCPDIRRLGLANTAQIWHWLQTHMQPYRVEDHSGQSNGMLTAYYEPFFNAQRQPDPVFRYPLYAAPVGVEGFGKRKPWLSRQQIESSPSVQAALAGHEIAWLDDPVKVLVLHIQGSGRLNMTEPDGRQRQVRAAFAATNDHPYRSVGKWLLDRGLVRDATWPGITAWTQANPSRVQEMLWSNPRYVFFREEALDEVSSNFGPKGAQGVPLTAERSIAVDRRSIPYGTPVWLSSSGPTQALNRLVLAQDTGSAIVGAVRADYFMGSGEIAGDIAGRTKQDLRLWVLWPKGAPAP